MANHISNTLEIVGSKEQVKVVRTFLKGKTDEDGNEVYIDFNNIARMPKCLDIEMNNAGTIAQYLLFGTQVEDSPKSIIEARQGFNRFDLEQQKDGLELAFLYENNFIETGFTTWYNWCLKNWGTKWNAYDQVLDCENRVHFRTAWDGVPTLIEKLSKIFPDVALKYRWNDDFYGSCGGNVTFLYGVAEIHSLECESYRDDELS